MAIVYTARLADQLQFQSAIVRYEEPGLPDRDKISGLSKFRRWWLSAVAVVCALALKFSLPAAADLGLPAQLTWSHGLVSRTIAPAAHWLGLSAIPAQVLDQDTLAELKRASAARDQRYPTFNMLPAFLGEETRGVVYLSTTERAEFEIFTYAGRLYDARGFLLCAMVRCYGMLVMDDSGRIYFSEAQERDYFHHSSFTAGGPLAFPGNAVIENGLIEEADCHSGHYEVSCQAFTALIAELERRQQPLPATWAWPVRVKDDLETIETVWVNGNRADLNRAIATTECGHFLAPSEVQPSL